MAAPQTGLTSCQIGDMGYPGTVHGNPSEACIADLHAPNYKSKNSPLRRCVMLGEGHILFTIMICLVLRSGDVICSTHQVLKISYPGLLPPHLRRVKGQISTG